MASQSETRLWCFSRGRQLGGGVRGSGKSATLAQWEPALRRFRARGKRYQSAGRRGCDGRAAVRRTCMHRPVGDDGRDRATELEVDKKSVPRAHAPFQRTRTSGRAPQARYAHRLGRIARTPVWDLAPPAPCPAQPAATCATRCDLRRPTSDRGGAADPPPAVPPIGSRGSAYTTTRRQFRGHRRQGHCSRQRRARASPLSPWLGVWPPFFLFSLPLVCGRVAPPPPWPCRSSSTHTHTLFPPDVVPPPRLALRRPAPPTPPASPPPCAGGPAAASRPSVGGWRERARRRVGGGTRRPPMTRPAAAVGAAWIPPAPLPTRRAATPAAVASRPHRRRSA
ncbi:hypothetical protein BU14_2400s0001, partial [Porphyra umbilicalis]